MACEYDAEIALAELTLFQSGSSMNEIRYDPLLCLSWAHSLKVSPHSGWPERWARPSQQS